MVLSTADGDRNRSDADGADVKNNESNSAALLAQRYILGDSDAMLQSFVARHGVDSTGRRFYWRAGHCGINLSPLPRLFLRFGRAAHSEGNYGNVKGKLSDAI